MAVTVAENHPDVLLVSMPFASYKQPSLALSIFKSILEQKGVKTQVRYFTLDYAELADRWLYDKISTWHLPDLLGDWIFAASIFPSQLPDWEEYVGEILKGSSREHRIDHFGKEPVVGFLLEQILALREETPAFLDRCVEVVAALQPRVLALTSGVHQQGASLALAKAVKEALPHIFIVLGGTNCAGVMGLETARQFPFLDAVVAGEGERVFPELVARVLAGKPAGGLAGVFGRGVGDASVSSREDCGGDGCAATIDPVEDAPPVDNLDALPYPDYSDFVAQWDARRLRRGRGRLLLETSRGCYWGQRIRCTFCGQASPTLDYRAKSPGRVAGELAHLVQRWPDFRICLTDEAVDPGVVAELARPGSGGSPGPEIVYIQVRPNIGREDIIRLRQAGVRRLEAGIESFSTGILALMRKGTRGLHNIAFLKWCRELGIEVVWNLLWGFPGEPPETYTAMANLLPLLFHLDPPQYAGAVRLERFSPLFENPGSFGLSEVRPYPAYHYVYPLEEGALNNLAYYFAFAYPEGQDVAAYTAPLAKMIALWKEHRGKLSLAGYDDGRRLLIVDGRSPFNPPEKIVLEGLERLVCLA
ncbi:MAG: RiPP maturation radical SAM C-methyltransferase, partial [bacterium]